MKNNAFNQTAPLIFYGWDPMRVQETPPPPLNPSSISMLRYHKVQ